MPFRSKIVPSMLSAHLSEKGVEPVTMPCIQSMKDVRYQFDDSPLELGCRKHGVLLPPFPEADVATVEDFLQTHFLEYCKPKVVPRSCIPYVDVIAPETSGDCGIALSTSVGYPLCMEGQKTTKSDYIEVVRDKHSKIVKVNIDSDLIKECERKRELRSHKIVPCTVFWDHLKDERRKMEKALSEGGTRVFSLSPIDFTLECRALFLDFRNAFTACWFDLFHAVSVDPDSSDWSRIVHDEEEIDGEYITIDFKDFGPTLTFQLTQCFYRLANAWYERYAPDTTPMHQLWREIISYEVINAVHLMGSTLYRVFSGIPSGHPETTGLNSFVHIFMMCLSYIGLTKLPLSTFRQNVRLRTYGDDGRAKVARSILHLFNIQTICAFLKRFGITATDGLKSSTPPLSVELSEVSFLKRGVVPHPFLDATYLAPLSENSIHDCAHWVWKSPDWSDTSRDNAEQSLRLAFGHGPAYFNNWRQMLNECLDSLDLPPLTLSWYDISYNNYRDHPYYEDSSCP